MIFNNNNKKETIEKLLLDKRPQYSQASLKTYASLIINLIKKNDIVDLDDVSKTIKFVKNNSKSQNSNKTILSAFYVITEKEEYKNAMLDEIDHYNAIVRKQEKSETDSENWLDYKDIEKIYEKQATNIWNLMRKNNEDLKPKERRDIKKFMMFLLTSGYFFPPRRSLDWTHMYWDKKGHENMNYIDDKYFYFNKYKTAERYNEHKLKIPVQVRKWLRQYKKHSHSELLFTDDTGNQLNSNTFNQKLHSFFGKNISTSLLRKIYLTDHYSDIPKLQTIHQTSKDMGHTFETAVKHYVKH